ncbi:MAG TPA: glycosyltransferase family 39 protein [Candidatus Methylacidiphilales bacterium]|nr:glycosyltransferase family 39 protein [Candidatus Methylacidiphilales bacterium]
MERGRYQILAGEFPLAMALRGGVAGTERPPSIRPRLSWLILGLITLLYVAVSFTPVVFDDNEGLYAGTVREMRERGNWLVPTSNGFPRIQKPPFVYWSMLVSTSLFGENEFALRLPNALATAGWIVATYLIMRRVGGEIFGLATALVLASMLGVWVFTHLIQPEPFLACFISLALWCLVEARLYAEPQPLWTDPSPVRGRFPGDHWYLLFWTFLALGALSKGLHGALWPLSVVLITALFIPNWRVWLRPVLTLRGFLIFLLLLIPWYAYMAVRFPGFLAAHFLNEQLGAWLDTRYPADARQLPLLQFYAQHLLFWMPWTLLLPGSIYALVKAIQSARQRPHAFPPQTLDLIGFLGIWVAVTMVSVAFSTRQDYYSMSCWGVVAAFFALPWMTGAYAFLRLPKAYLVVPALLLALIGTVALGFAIWIWPQLGSLGEATAAPIRDRDTFLDAIAGISPALWGQFVTLLIVFGVILIFAGAGAALLAWRRHFFAALATLSGAMAVPIILAAIGFTIMAPYFSLAGSARVINRELAAQPNAIVACEALPHTASSLLYYLNARIHWVNAPFDNQYAQRVLGEGRDYYWDDAGLLAKWNSPHPLYFIIEQSRLGYWQNRLSPGARVVSKSGTRLVLCNR